MIKDKRNSLESFIKEQLIGPGGCGNNFGVYVSNENEKELVCEVLNTTPGSIYSTGILFPRKDNQSLFMSDLKYEMNDDENIGDENLSDEDSDEQGDDMRDLGNQEEDEDINSLSRRFPDRIGISCCVKNIKSLTSSSKITISGRYYKKLSEKTRLYVNIEDYDFFEKVYSIEKCKDLFSQYFRYQDKKLSLLKVINKAQDLKDFRDKMRELNKYFCSIIAKNPNGEYDSIYTDSSFQDKNKFLSAYKERLFKSLKYVNREGEYLSPDKVAEHKVRIAKIEQYETFLSYFEDILSICDSKGFGFWVGTNFCKEIDLSAFAFDFESGKRKIIIPPKEGVTKGIVKYTLTPEVEASLSIWLQIYKGINGKTYLKVMLANDSTKVKVDTKHYYSIVAEKINELTFFGVKIDVSSSEIIPYRNEINPELDDCEVSSLQYLYRYTLRLLTTQQFQRALRLILALEQIRKWDKYNLGDKEISIGLFVGESSLPNHYKNLAEEIRKNWVSDGGHGQIPLDRCPWCGSLLRDKEVSVDHYYFGCSNKKCTYGKRNYLPIRLCDDHVYEEPPTLLFGTVDKFAQLARRVNVNEACADSRRLFGNGTGCNPPDLIIQDELHLLLGPLGSAVSLFEAAIDQLCSYKRQDGLVIRPKIISSTATTRNTSFQVRALYDRDICIFPKNGTDYDDSFFAFYKRDKQGENDNWSYVSKRKYIGIMPTGRTQMTTQMRLAAILFVHRALYERKNKALLEINDKSFIEAADYYYSIISYFNSLKEVGKTDAQFYLEFTKYTRRLFKRVLRFTDMLECFYAYNEIFSKTELTGRLSGGDAVKELTKVQTIKWDPNKRLPYLKEGETNIYNSAILPADYILATNMISVGLDVSRFNTIIINSMPRNIAEYIQASSRVARDKEGLVLTLHNPFRSRDMSHFERFREFHEKLYYYVEPISITPFSPKAVEKYMPLYMATIIRHLYKNLADRKDANKMSIPIATELKSELKKYFENRYARTQALDSTLHALEREIITKEQLSYIYEWIDVSLDQWVNKAEQYGDSLVYYAAGRKGAEEVSLLVSTDDYSEQKAASKWIVPSALRLVEPEAVLHILNK